jgi:uncharacterized repeat protein (TIGR01451 family)
MVSRTKLALLTAAVLVPLLLIVVSVALAQEPVWIAKSDSPDPVHAGEELFYEIFVTPPDGGPWWVSDTLPPEVTYISDTLEPITIPGGTEVLTEGCQLVGNELGCLLWASPSEPRSFQIKTRVAPDAVAGMDTGTAVANNVAWLTWYEDEEGPQDPLTFAAEGTFIEDLADLAVVKMSKPDIEVEAGEEFVYTIFVENLGPSYARNVSIRDEILSSGAFTIVDVILDPDRDDVGPFFEPSPLGGQTIEFDLLEPLEPKGIYNQGRWVIQVVVVADETQDVNNLVNVFSRDIRPGGPAIPTADPDLSNNTAEDFIYVTDVADLSLDKVLVSCDGPLGDCVAGGFAQFNVTVWNDGPSTAENVVVQDLLPAGVTVVEALVTEGSGYCTTGIPGDPFAPLTCNLGPLVVRDGNVISILVRIDPDYVDAELPSDFRLLENDAWTYSDIFDPDNTHNRDYVILPVGTWSDVGMYKSGPEFAMAGQEMIYHINVWNPGPSTLQGFLFYDNLPPEVEYLGYEFGPGTGTCIYPWSGSHTVLCYLDDMAPGAESHVQFRVGIKPDVPPGTVIVNGIAGYWSDSAAYLPEPFPEVATEVTALADLAITKTSEPMKIYPGEQKHYHIEVTNNGPTIAPDVMVTDTLPISVTYEIDNDTCDLMSQEPDVLECHLGNMMPGETRAFDVWALVSRDAPPGEITNEAYVYMGGEVPYEDPNEENNSAWATNLVLEPTVADLGLQKEWGPAPPEWFDGAPFAPEDCYPTEGVLRAGCPLTFSLTISNTGPLLAENVVVEDLMPAGVTVEGLGPSQGSCTTGIPGDPSAPLTCNLGNIPRDEGAGITVFARADVDLAWEPLENDALVSSDVPDPDNGNNRSHVLIWVEPFSYLDLDKEGPSEIMAGQEIEYWINLRNDGPSMAHDVHLDDELPGGVSLLDAQVMIGDGSCEPGSALCSLGDMEPWDNRAVRVRGYVEPWLEEGTVVTNTVRAWADSPFFQPDPMQPISDTLETLVHSGADLSIHKTSDPYKVYAGEQKRYDIEVTNHGPSVARNVVVSDTLPSGVEFEISTIGCGYQPATMLGASQPNEGGELFSVDLGSGAGSFIADMPDDELAAEIEYDNTSGRLFAAQGFRPWYEDTIAPRLYELDPETGESLGYVGLSEDCALPGLEFVDGTLFGACNYDPPHDSGMPYLVTVDPDTGEVYEVDSGPIIDEYSLIHGLAWDESARIMYGLVIQEGPNELVTIDLDTGEGDFLCDIYDEDYSDYAYDLRAIEFGPDGTLYGGIAEDSDLVIIDPTPQEDNGQYCNMHHVGDTGYSVSGLTLMGGSEIACHLGEIPPGETRNFSIFVRVKPDTLGIINNQVDVSSDNDPNPDNDHWSEANLVLGKADLRVLKYGKPDGIVQAGDRLTYTVIVDNLGPGYAHEVVLYDLFSSSSWAYYVYDWRSDRPADCSWDEWGRDTRITCQLDDPLEVMSPSSSGRWVLKFYLEVFEEQSVNNVAQVVGSDYDPDLSNNYAIVEHEITAVADLDVEKVAWGEVLVGCEGETELWENEVAAGGELEYTLYIENEGPSDAENVVVEDWGLSPFLDIEDVDCEKDDWWRQCSCNLSGLGELGDTDRHFVCYMGEIDDDDQDMITIRARIPSDVPEGTRLVNDARVYSDVFDDDNGDNLDYNWTYVIANADLAVEKSQEPEIALPTMDITYSITVTNLGPSDVQGVFISDTFPVQVLNPTWTCCASDGECDVPCEPPVCPEEPCPWPDIGLFAQADIPADEWVIYTVEGVLDVWPCGLPFTNTVEIIAPQSLVHPEMDIDPCDENNVDEAVNDIPVCGYDPLVLKNYPGPDSPP